MALDVEEVVARVNNMRAGQRDEEYDHQAEDALYLDVLREIARAEGHTEFYEALAAAALGTQEIIETRWYA